jgi:hypothetical protein
MFSDGQEIPCLIMEPKDSLRCLQQPATGPYSKPNEPRPHPHTLFI